MPDVEKSPNSLDTAADLLDAAVRFRERFKNQGWFVSSEANARLQTIEARYRRTPPIDSIGWPHMWGGWLINWIDDATGKLRGSESEKEER